MRLVCYNHGIPSESFLEGVFKHGLAYGTDAHNFAVGLTSALDSAKDAHLAIGLHLCIIASFVRLAGHGKTRTVLMVSFVADRKEHIIGLNNTVQLAIILVVTKGRHNLMAPFKGGLNADFARFGALSQGGPLQHQADIRFPLCK